MKLKLFILTALSMLFFNLDLLAQVQIETTEDNSIIASTNSTGASGYKGCKGHNLREVSPYIFKLYKRDTLEKVCRTNQNRKWRQQDSKTANNGKAVFNTLEKGEYFVECLIGEAKGCLIDDTDGKELRSIVYRKETSTKVHLKKPKNEHYAFQKQTMLPISGDVLVFPNPANEVLKIRVKNNAFVGQVVIAVISLTGKEMILKTENVASKDGQQYEWEIQTDRIPKGTYILQIHDEQGVSYRQKVIIMHEELSTPQVIQTNQNN